MPNKLQWPTDSTRKPALSLHDASLRAQRKAVASREPEDAGITGMTRSLDRRLLALNIGPRPSAVSPQAPARRVA